MSYQDMLNLKKGDLIFVRNIAGEVTGKGSRCGSPAIWLKHVNERGETVEALFTTGADFKEEAWYEFKEHLLIRWQNDLKEEHSLKNRYEQQNLF